MNFTREPIIETIITPKEGSKLLIRSSRASGGEEYSVDAVEVVSFGNSFFYRSQERPKSFLVPVSDYEIVETKETRIVLKNASIEKSIKIGSSKSSKEPEAAAVEQKIEKKRERRRHRRRREPTDETKEEPKEAAATEPAVVGEKEKPATLINKLIPPPSKLISESIVKGEEPTASVPEPEIEGKEKKTKAKKSRKSSKKKVTKKEQEEETPPPPPEDEGGEMQKMSAETIEPVEATSYASLEPAPFVPFGSDFI